MLDAHMYMNNCILYMFCNVCSMKVCTNFNFVVWLLLLK